MKRFEAIGIIADRAGAIPVVCTLGHTCQELFKTADRPTNFYMLGSMGMASSIGLGIALSRPGKVVAIDGDAAVTMNMGSLATIGHAQPADLILVILDNQANGATGFQPSMSARSLRLDQVARGCGIAAVSRVGDPAGLATAMNTAMNTAGPHVIVVDVETGVMPGLQIIPMGPADIRNRFMDALK